MTQSTTGQCCTSQRLPTRLLGTKKECRGPFNPSSESIGGCPQVGLVSRSVSAAKGFAALIAFITLPALTLSSGNAVAQEVPTGHSIESHTVSGQLDVIGRRTVQQTTNAHRISATNAPANTTKNTEKDAPEKSSTGTEATTATFAPYLEPLESQEVAIEAFVREATSLDMHNSMYAIDAWLDAAHAGHTPAMHIVATRLHAGDGIPCDHKSAALWWHEAAKLGHAQAAYNFGWCQLNGHGVTRNPPQAVAWFALAAAQGQVDAIDAFANCLSQGIGTPRDLNAALSWWTTAAEQGHVPAMRALALAHQFGRGTPVNQQRASSWWLSAAQGGDIQAMLITAANHEMGRGLPRSPIEADLWYARASYLMLPAPQDRALTLAE
jgi:hypothetical protein